MCRRSDLIGNRANVPFGFVGHQQLAGLLNDVANEWEGVFPDGPPEGAIMGEHLEEFRQAFAVTVARLPFVRPDCCEAWSNAILSFYVALDRA